METKISNSPPLTNRGVVNTLGPKISQKNFLESIEYRHILFDWFQCTIFVESNPYKLFKELFNVDQDYIFVEEKGVFGYNLTYNYQNIKIMVNNRRDDMGVHILCSGQACRDIESMGINYIDLFTRLKKYGAKYTRVDVSVDVFKDCYFSIDKIRDCINNNQVISRFKKTTEFSQTEISSGLNTGYTVWFGSRQSDIQVVFYDKLKERKSADVPIVEDVDFWNRLEVRFRSDYANDVILNYIENNDNFNDYYFGIVSNYVSFIEYDVTDTNRSRANVLPWWSNFLNDCSKIKLYNVNVEKQLYKIDDWLDTSVSRSLFISFIADVDPNNVNFDKLKKKLYLGYENFTTNDLNLINDYRMSKNLPLITIEDIGNLIINNFENK
ncbi:MAG: replication initiation factor domain-containing protein [Bacilli bacterium]